MELKEKILVLDLNIKKALSILADTCYEQSMNSFSARVANERLIELKKAREQLIKLLRTDTKESK